MPLYKPSELHAFLNGIGARPRKALSQNFLIDGNIIKKLIEISGVQPGDLVLDIGAGPGVITEAFLESGAKALAIEKDPILAKALKRFPNLEVFCEDFLEFPIEDILQARLPKGKKAIVVGSLPYQITSPILTRLAPLTHLISHIHVIIQKEVAIRFTATPGGRDYGSSTVFLNFYSTPNYEFTVKAGCFYPAPKVDSAIVSFALKKHPDVKSTTEFFQLTQTAFNQKRKMIRKSLSSIYPTERILWALDQLGWSDKTRPEELPVESWVALLEQLGKS